MSDGSQDSAHIKQYHYTSWPDHGVPENGSPLILYHQKIMTQYRNTQGGPIIVHCRYVYSIVMIHHTCDISIAFTITIIMSKINYLFY